MPNAPPKPGPLLKAALAAIVKRLRHLLERFETDTQGRTKIFRDDAILGLQAFVTGTLLLPELHQREEMRLNLSTLAEAVKDVQPDELRQLPVLRETIAADLRHALRQLEPWIARRKEQVA